LGDKNELAEAIYGVRESGFSDQQLASLVSRLRKKILDDAKDPFYLFARHGQGFELKNWIKVGD